MDRWRPASRRQVLHADSRRNTVQTCIPGGWADLLVQALYMASDLHCTREQTGGYLLVEGNVSEIDKYEILVLGSGEAGKYLAWTMAKAGRRTAVVERRRLGGSCPNIACLPSKNLIHSARVVSLARRGAEFGLETNSLAVSMKDVQRRKRLMVDGLHQTHVARTVASGVELIMGDGRFVAPRTVEIALTDGGSRRIFGERVFLVLGSRAAMPKVPGLAAANPMTHIEALDLDRLPAHLIVMGGGYVGLELAQ